MSVLDVSLVLALRIGVILVLYAFLLALILAALRDLSVEREPTGASASHRLIVLDPGQTELVAGQVLPLWTVTALGRDRENAVVLDDEFVSAVHASAYRLDGQWWLRDEGSTNGTVLNGKPVHGEAHLQPGDEIQIGSVHLQVVL
jgi:pSer/pThr/pTyr-binding forkhead associated (FHA) protein